MGSVCFYSTGCQRLHKKNTQLPVKPGKGGRVVGTADPSVTKKIPPDGSSHRYRVRLEPIKLGMKTPTEDANCVAGTVFSRFACARLEVCSMNQEGCVVSENCM